MAKLTRVKGKVFAGSAQLSDIGQFGSALAGTPTNTQDVATIQALSAYDEGWNSAVITSRNYPPIEEVNGVLKTISYQTCYMLQEGIPEYDIGTEYSNTSIVKSVNGTRLDFYISLQNNNVGHALSDTDYWAKATLNAGKNIGEIVTSVIPLSDSGLHLLDGTVLSGSGVYADFVNYIASIYDASLSYFTTEADWQNSVSKYGSCGKFVYDSENNTVRLPKIVGFIEGASGVSALGGLTQAGLPNITGAINPAWETDIPRVATGAFRYTTNTANNEVPNPPARGGVVWDFDASRSNSIYGKSSTVQPQSIKVLYYIVLANDVKNTLQVDIDEILSDLANKADVDGSNMVSSVKNFDGQWTFVNVPIASEVTYTQEQAVAYDISSYLPNDSYDYEVLFTAYLRTAETTNSATGCHLFSGSSANNTAYSIRIGRCVTRTNASANASGNGVLPIFYTDRKVTWQNSDSNGTSGNCGLRMMAYRRIGTNA